MNEIQAALKKKGNLKERVELYEKYGSDQGLKLAFKTRIHDRRIAEMLDYQLKLLKFKPFVEKYIPPQGHKTPGRKPNTYVPPPPPPKQENKPTYYPKEIAAAIQKRSKAANARDKAGRKLTNHADTLGKVDRAALVAEQKRQHDIVASQTKIIDKWKKDGAILKDESNKNGLSDDQIEAFEKEWRYKLKLLSRERRRVEKYSPGQVDADEAELAKANVNLRKVNERLDTLALLLGRERRKPNGYNKRPSQKTTEKTQ